MRPIILAAALIAAPAAAAPSPADSPIPSPREIDAAGYAMGRMLDALLGIDVGPLMEAADPGRRPARRRETLGDVARRDDPDFDRRMHRSIDAVTGGMGDMMARLATLEPVLRGMIDDLDRRLDEAELRDGD